jgi:hypothetical protein
VSRATDGADTSRYVIVRGGQPSAEQIAALTVALTPVVVEDDTAAAQRSAWTQAALLEGVGTRRVVSAPDLATPRRPVY